MVAKQYENKSSTLRGPMLFVARKKTEDKKKSAQNHDTLQA